MQSWLDVSDCFLLLVAKKTEPHFMSLIIFDFSQNEKQYVNNHQKSEDYMVLYKQL